MSIIIPVSPGTRERSFGILWSCANCFAADERLEDAIVIQISSRFGNTFMDEFRPI